MGFMYIPSTTVSGLVTVGVNITVLGPSANKVQEISVYIMVY